MQTTMPSTLGMKKPNFWMVARRAVETKAEPVKVANLALVATMNRAANDTSIPKRAKTIEIRNIRGNAYHADVIPKKSIRLHGFEHNSTTPHDYDITFNVGDVAVYGSYNLTYTGKIVSIGEKTVKINHGSRSTVLKFDDFNFWNNNFDAAKIAKHNAEWMD
jgi:hypothetical protein